jgi:hypothetical protein
MHRNPGGAGGQEQLAGHDAGLLPLVEVGHDLLLDERAEAGAEQVVLLVEQQAAHGADGTLRGCP